MNKKIKIWLFILFTLIGTGISSTHAYQELMIEERWGKPIRVIKVVLDGEHFVVASPAGLWWDTTENLAKKVWGNTAINAAFFCPDDYSNCRINGKRVTHTISERVFLWDGKSRSPFGEIPVLEQFSLLTKKENLFLYKKIVDFMMKASEVISIKTNLIRFIFEFETFLSSCSKEKM